MFVGLFCKCPAWRSTWPVRNLKLAQSSSTTPLLACAGKRGIFDRFVNTPNMASAQDARRSGKLPADSTTITNADSGGAASGALSRARSGRSGNLPGSEASKAKSGALGKYMDRAFLSGNKWSARYGTAAGGSAGGGGSGAAVPLPPQAEVRDIYAHDGSATFEPTQEESDGPSDFATPRDGNASSSAYATPRSGTSSTTTNSIVTGGSGSAGVVANPAAAEPAAAARGQPSPGSATLALPSPQLQRQPPPAAADVGTKRSMVLEDTLNPVPGIGDDGGDNRGGGSSGGGSGGDFGSHPVGGFESGDAQALEDTPGAANFVDIVPPDSAPVPAPPAATGREYPQVPMTSQGRNTSIDSEGYDFMQLPLPVQQNAQ